MFYESVSSSYGGEIDYDWVPSEPVDGSWPSWLWEKDEPTLSNHDVTRIQNEIQSNLVERPLRVSDLPPPRYLLLVNPEEAEVTE